MRVVHVLYTFSTGGLEKGVATVVRKAAPGFDHTVLCLSRSGESSRLLPPATAVIEMGKRSGNSPWFLWRLSRRLRALGPDVVHTRNWGGIDGVLAARLAGLRRVVHGEHGWDVGDPDGTNRRRVRVRRLVARWVREYTCVSRRMQEWLQETIRVPRPVTQIYNGVDTELYRPSEDRASIREGLGISGGSFVVGIVGRLDPIKDHRGLFRAFDAFRATHGSATLLVVGDGPERQTLERLAGEGVVFLGDREDVPRILGALDLFVLTSLNEGVSNVILEAMATAVPVVATAVGGNPELVRDGVTGFLVPPTDPRALEAALRRYTEDPNLGPSHGAAGRRRAVQEFGVLGMTRSYEEVWARVAVPRRPPRKGSAKLVATVPTNRRE